MFYVLIHALITCWTVITTFYENRNRKVEKRKTDRGQ